MIRILSAGLRGGGNLVSDEDVADMSVEGGIARLARLTGELLAATFGGPEEQRKPLRAAAGVRRSVCLPPFPWGAGDACRALPAAASCDGSSGP